MGVNFNLDRRLFDVPVMPPKPQEDSQKISGIFGQTVQVRDGSYPVDIVNAQCPDELGNAMVVTLRADLSSLVLAPTTENSFLRALLYFGCERAQVGPIPISIGNGVTFQVPGSIVRVQAQAFANGASGISVPVTGLISRGVFPKSTGARLLYAITPYAVSAFASIPVPPFATEFRLERLNYSKSNYTINVCALDGVTPLYSRIVNAGDDCPWIPIIQLATVVQIVGPSSDIVQPIFAIEF